MLPCCCRPSARPSCTHAAARQQQQRSLASAPPWPPTYAVSWCGPLQLVLAAALLRLARGQQGCMRRWARAGPRLLAGGRRSCGSSSSSSSGGGGGPASAGLPKDLGAAMAADYQPGAVEAGWYDWWEQEGLFKPEAARPGAVPFTMVLPPPNVTGALSP